MRRCTAHSRFLSCLSFALSTALNGFMVVGLLLIYWGVM
jgi:hypothetical protein